MADCPQEDTLLAYLEERMEETRRREVGSHVENCESCRAALKEMRPAPPIVDTVHGSQPPPSDAADAAAVGRPQVPGHQVGDRLGAGGMGEVYAGRDDALNRDVAVKVLLACHGGRPDLKRRFVEEAQVASQLQHPGVPPVHGLGVLPDGRPFFTMKLVKGRTLDELLRERTSPADDLPRFLKVFEQVCQALAYAHSKNVLHRDLKPANVMVGAFGEVQVMDWGLAKVLTGRERGREENPPAGSVVKTVRTADADGRTQAGSILGTWAYMPPEQARGEVDRLDARSDVFGLGAILCELLTGQPPYVGSAERVRLQAQLGEPESARERLAARKRSWWTWHGRASTRTWRGVRRTRRRWRGLWRRTRRGCRSGCARRRWTGRRQRRGRQRSVVRGGWRCHCWAW